MGKRRGTSSHTAYIQTAHLNSYKKSHSACLKYSAHTLIWCLICSLEFAFFLNPFKKQHICEWKIYATHQQVTAFQFLHMNKQVPSLICAGIKSIQHIVRSTPFPVLCLQQRNQYTKSSSYPQVCCFLRSRDPLGRVNPILLNMGRWLHNLHAYFSAPDPSPSLKVLEVNISSSSPLQYKPRFVFRSEQDSAYGYDVLSKISHTFLKLIITPSRWQISTALKTHLKYLFQMKTHRGRIAYRSSESLKKKCTKSWEFITDLCNKS